MVEALKARYLIYGLMLRYFLWMGAAQPASAVGHHPRRLPRLPLLRGLPERQPALAPFIWPLLIAYIAFAVLTWIASPLFNLLLLLNRFGRHALSREQKLGAVLVGLLLPPALVALILYLTTGDFVAFLCAVYFGLLLLPVSTIFKCPAGWPRRCLIAYTSVLAALGPAFVVAYFNNGNLAGIVFYVFFVGSAFPASSPT